MQDELNTIIAKLDDLKGAMTPKPESLFDRLLRVLEKLVLPVLVGLLAWVGNQAATKISEGQLELARAAAEDRRLEFQRGMQAKYLEIFYKDLNSGEQSGQLNAIRLLRVVDSDLAERLIALVTITPGVTQVVIEKANEAKRDLDQLRPLSGFKIGLFYYRDNEASTSQATRSREQLQKLGFSGTIQMIPSDDESLKAFDPPKSVEVRYEAGIEDDASMALLGIVQPVVAPAKIDRFMVRNRTANYISIFYPRGG